MKNYAGIALLLGLFSCKKQVAPKATTAHSEVVALKYAQCFKIFKTPENTQVQVYNLKDTLQYTFSRTTTTESIQVPLDKIVLSSTTDIPMLEALSAEAQLVGFPSTHYISSAKTRERIDAGKVVDVGTATQLNIELLLGLQPDAMVAFSVSHENKAQNQLQKAGIPVLMNASWQELHPLGRAEWIKFFGILLDKEAEAQRIFETIELQYQNLAEKAQNAPQKPKVLSGNPYQGIWYVPGGKSYMAQLIADAGGDYVWADNPDSKSLSFDFESVYQHAKDADVWIDAGDFENYTQFVNFDTKYPLFKACQKQALYSKNKKGPTGGSIYYEYGALHPEWALSDLIQIFHPELNAPQEFYFYRKLLRESI